MPPGDFRKQSERRPQKHAHWHKHLTVLEEFERAMRLKQARLRVKQAEQDVLTRKAELGQLVLDYQAEGLPILRQLRILGTDRTTIYNWTQLADKAREQEREARNVRLRDGRRADDGVAGDTRHVDFGFVHDPRPGDSGEGSGGGENGSAPVAPAGEGGKE